MPFFRYPVERAYEMFRLRLTGRKIICWFLLYQKRIDEKNHGKDGQRFVGKEGERIWGPMRPTSEDEEGKTRQKTLLRLGLRSLIFRAPERKALVVL